MGYSVNVLNSIRKEASQEYKNRIPEATQENITAVGNALQAYTVLYNEFCDALINKIGKTILETKLFKNRLARFKQGTVLNQQDVEEIFVEMAKAEGAYNPAGPNPLGRREPPDVKAIYHRQNRQDYYCVSIGDVDFKRVFRSEATLDSFISALINSVYSGANYDEWQAMKNLIASYDGYAEYKCPELASDTWSEWQAAVNMHPGDSFKFEAERFLMVVRKAVTDLSFPSTKYNKAGVMTYTNPEDLVFLVNKDVLAHVDVFALSKAFHIGKQDIQVEIIPMDDFGSLTNTYGILVDKNWFRVYDTLSHMEPQRNAQGLFTNYFYHVHQILSASTFKNAVRFVPQPGAVITD